MDGNTLVAIVAALAALGAMYYARGQVKEAKRAAHAAEEQTKIARQVSIDAAQPYVWADIRIDDTQGTALNLVVGNSGPTVARNVRVKIDPPPPSSPHYRKGVEAAVSALKEGIESLPPGRSLVWGLGMGFELMNNDSIPQSYMFTITADGPFGDVPAMSYVVNMTNWQETQDQPAGTLHRLTKAVDRLTKTISERPE